jgi:hypothetical protein
MLARALSLVDYGPVNDHDDKKHQHSDQPKFAQAKQEHDEPKSEWVILPGVTERAVLHEAFGACPPQNETAVSNEN